jgi:F-box/WD-40 domain protein 7
MILWNLKDGKKLLTLTGHLEVINCIKMRFGVIVSGSSDATVRIWRISIEETKRIYLKSNGKTETRNEMRYTVCLADVKTLEGHQSDVYCLDFNAYYIASSGSDSKILIWNFEGDLIHTLTGHLGVVRHLYIDDHKLVSGGDAKKIMIWDYRVRFFLQLSCVRENIKNNN